MLGSNERYIGQGRHSGVSSCARGAFAAAILAAAVTGVTITGIGAARAAATTWVGATSNDFNTAANWSSGLPTQSVNANINTVAAGDNAPDILQSETVTVSNLNLGNISSGTDNGSLTIDGILNIAQTGTSVDSKAMTIGYASYTGTGTGDTFNSVTLDSTGQVSLDAKSELRVGNQNWGEFDQVGGTLTSADAVEMGVIAPFTSPSVGGIPDYSGFGGVYQMQGGTATFDNKLAIGQAVSAEFVQTGGKVTVQGGSGANTGLVLSESTASTVTGTEGAYVISGGSLDVTSTNGINGGRGGVSTSVFDVQGSNATSITTTAFNLSATGSTLEIGLDANGSTLIADSGKFTLGSGTTLDVNELPGFNVNGGNVVGEPGWYRIASVGGTLTDSGITLHSDTGVVYSLVNDPGYLTIDVTSAPAIPEPATLGMLAIGGLSMLLMGRRKVVAH